MLTGITDGMVRDAPRIESALPAFLEFASGSVLVAHNAGFDIGFLKAAAARTGTPWPGFAVLDTLYLARQLVVRDESPNHRLGSLAQVFGATTTPDHRALHDARATVDVLHGLIERVGNLGVHTLEELVELQLARDARPSAASGSSPTRCRTRPGVYLFKDGNGRVLYVGTSRDIRTRVRTYFTASEQRSRMAEMVRLAQVVHPVVCQTPLEAQVRELRLIDEHKPRFNRRSKDGRKVDLGQADRERFPRLSHRQAGARRRRPLHRSVPVARQPPSPPSTPCTRSCRCASARAALGPVLGLRARRHGPVRRPLHRRPVRGRLRHRRRRRRRDLQRQRPAGRRAAARPARGARRPRSGSRTPPGCATASCSSSAAPPGPSASPR